MDDSEALIRFCPGYVIQPLFCSCLFCNEIFTKYLQNIYKSLTKQRQTGLIVHENKNDNLLIKLGVNDMRKSEESNKLIREKRKEIIEAIFNNLLTEENELNQFKIYLKKALPQDTELDNHLNDFKKALIKEVDVQAPSCDHPLRAALALEEVYKGGVEHFTTNLANFHKEVNDSKLYPVTKIAAAVVLVGIALFAVFLIFVAPLIGTLGAIMIPWGLWGGMLMTCASLSEDIDFAPPFSDVFKTKDTGNAVHNFFALNQKKIVPTSSKQESERGEPNLLAALSETRPLNC